MIDQLRNTSLLITGATGFIGSSLIRHLLTLNDLHHYNLHILPVVRDRAKAEQLFGPRNDITYMTQDIRLPLGNLPSGIDYIIHCAAVTQSSHMIAKPVETTDTIILGTRNILEAARLAPIKSMVYLSSMEIYGRIPDTGLRTDETESGTLDLLNVRSCYPLGKQMAENYCISYFKEYQVPVKIARLAQTFGKGVLPGDNRIFAQFAKALVQHRDLTLHTPGNSVGNYCDTDDAISALLLLLIKGENGEAYNVVNEALTMTIREMAELTAAKLGERGTKVVFVIPGENLYGYAPDTGLRLSSSKLRALGWEPKSDMIEMYKKMMNQMESPG